MELKKQIGVIGGGSWGTAIVKILTDNDEPKQVYWWVRNEQTAEHIRKYHHNPNYLSSIQIDPESVAVSSDIKEVAAVCDVLILAIPSAFLHDALSDISAADIQNKKLVSAIKGLVPETGQIVGEYLAERFEIDTRSIAVIAGPSHAEEVSLEKLSYLTIASEDLQLAEDVSAVLQCRYLRTFTSDDIYGTEYAAVLKNIYAIASGICHGLGYGDNFQAVLMSNAITEIKRFIEAVHPIERDTDGSAYLGDLLVTGYSQFSRNRTFGNMLGKGYSVKTAQLEMNMIAEGYYAARSIHKLNQKYGVHMPLLEFVYEVIYEEQKPRAVIQKLVDSLT